MTANDFACFCFIKDTIRLDWKQSFIIKIIIINR